MMWSLFAELARAKDETLSTATVRSWIRGKLLNTAKKINATAKLIKLETVTSEAGGNTDNIANNIKETKSTAGRQPTK